MSAPPPYPTPPNSNTNPPYPASNPNSGYPDGGYPPPPQQAYAGYPNPYGASPYPPPPQGGYQPQPPSYPSSSQDKPAYSPYGQPQYGNAQTPQYGQAPPPPPPAGYPGAQNYNAQPNGVGTYNPNQSYYTSTQPSHQPYPGQPGNQTVYVTQQKPQNNADDLACCACLACLCALCCLLD